MYSLLADAVVLVHGAFILFVVIGGFLVLRWRKLVWLHIPAAAWGVAIEAMSWICPLTPLENFLRVRAGESVYSVGYIEHYIVPLIYPAGLTRTVQWTLIAVVTIANAIAYTLVIRRRHRASASVPASSA